MMAYVSGDMQGTSDGSWVWQGSETGSELESIPSTVSHPVPGNAGWSGESSEDWEGWDWLERTIQYLLAEAQKRQQQQQQSAYEMHFQMKPVEPGPVVDERTVETPQRSDSNSNAHSRMTIASII